MPQDRKGAADYVRQFFTNWAEYDGPVGKKLWLTAKNRSKAFAPPFKGCCGNHGEPGC